MKATYLVIAALALPVTAEAAEIDPATVQLWDVVYTADGTVLKGVIVEEVPSTSVRILLVGGSSIVVPLGDVVRFARELNPTFSQQPPASARAAEPPGGPKMTAASGLRLAVMPGLAAHTDADTGFWLSGRLGYEIGLGQWGLIPGIVGELTPDVGTYGEAGGAVFAAMRAAYRGSSVSPFVSFGIGPGIVADDVSLAIFMGAGVDLIVHRRFALTAEAKFHRGFGDTYIRALSFAAFGLGVELRL